LIAAVNAQSKVKLGIEQFTRVYVTGYDGDRTGAVRAVIAAESVTALNKGFNALMTDPDLQKTREELRGSRQLGASVLYQGIRFDGTYKNSSVYTTDANVMDEAGYLVALDGLRTLFDAHGFADAKINAYRVMAGRTTHSHRVAIAFENEERLAAFLDFIGSSADMRAWLASASKLRTVVSNGTARDITK